MADETMIAVRGGSVGRLLGSHQRWSLLLLFGAIALTGGTARPDSLAQVLVRAAAALALVVWLLLPHPINWSRLKAPFALLGAAATLAVVQLVPLPPGLWATLPGHAVYAASATAIDMAQPWRPIALVPARAYSALFSLLVPLAVLVGASRLTSRDRARMVLWIGVLALASGVLGLAQLSGGRGSVLRWYAVNNDYAGTGFFANRNHQALLLALAIPALAAWAVVPGVRPDRRRVRQWLALGTSAFLMLMLPTTGSRAGVVLGVLAILTGGAIAFGETRRRFSAMRRRTRRRFVAGVLLGALAFVAVLFLFGRNEAFHRLSTLNAADDLRASILPVVWTMTRAFFPFGAGFGSFDSVFQHYEPFDQLRLTYFNQAHTDLVQPIYEGGLPAVCLMIAFLLWWLIATWRAWRVPVSAQSLAARAGSGMIMLVLVASVVDYPARTPLIMGLAALACAFLCTPFAGQGEEELSSSLLYHDREPRYGLARDF